MRPAVLPFAARPRHPFRIFCQITLALMALTLAAALSPARAAQISAAEVNRAMDSVLIVHSADDSDRFLGSAFLWGDAAQIAVTYAHVVDNAAEVRLIDRHGVVVMVPVIARDASRDIALLGLRGALLGRAGLLPGAAPLLGEAVWALGAPLGLGFTLTAGIVSADPRQVETAVPLRLLQHSAAVNPGSSGGPLVDTMGRLVGMNTRIADGSRMFVGIAYAITAGDLARLVPQLLAGDLLPVPRLDLRARPLDRQMARALSVPAEGLLIDAVGQGGLAARAGLRAGDILLTMGGIAIEDAGALAFLVEAALPKGQIDLTLLRGGQMIRVTLSLTLPPSEGGLLSRGVIAQDVMRVASYRLDELGFALDANARLTELRLNSPAVWSGLGLGDRILAINGQPMDATALRGFEITAPVVVLVQAVGGQTRHVFLDPWTTSAGLRPLGGANVLDPSVVVF